MGNEGGVACDCKYPYGIGASIIPFGKMGVGGVVAIESGIQSYQGSICVISVTRGIGFNTIESRGSSWAIDVFEIVSC